MIGSTDITRKDGMFKTLGLVMWMTRVLSLVKCVLLRVCLLQFEEDLFMQVSLNMNELDLETV